MTQLSIWFKPPKPTLPAAHLDRLFELLARGRRLRQAQVRRGGRPKR